MCNNKCLTMCNNAECWVLTLYACTVLHLLNINTIIISLLFRDWFTTTSKIYKRLGQFDYGQPNCTTDHIKTCIGRDEDWIYIGEVKEGTDDTPHGIGIKVDRYGYTQQLNDKALLKRW